MQKVVVEEYNPQWPLSFAQIKAHIWPQIKDVAMAIEHVGSTSVPGLAAKPVIDVDVVISAVEMLPTVIERLTTLGYEHRGDLGIAGRHAFAAPKNAIRQNFYVCVQGCLSLRNHLALRDRLRLDPMARDEYARIKRELAVKFSDSIDSYIEGKSAFILSILASSGIEAIELESVRIANLADQRKA